MMMNKIWNTMKLHQGEEFHTIGNKHLPFTYQFVDENNITVSRTGEWIPKKSFEKVLEKQQAGQTAAQINQSVRASYYIIAIMEDRRISG